MAGPHTHTRPRAGFTLVEALVCAAILALVLGSLGMTLNTSSATLDEGRAVMALEREGSRALREVVDALRGADAPSIAAVPAPPLSTNRVDYQTNQGFDGVQVSWSAPRRLSFDPAAGTLTWLEDPGLPTERRQVLCRGVPRFLEGETFNGLDDNGNGLIDEGGFSIARQGELLILRLTVEQAGRGGRVRARTWESNLFVRN